MVRDTTRMRRAPAATAARACSAVASNRLCHQTVFTMVRHRHRHRSLVTSNIKPHPISQTPGLPNPSEMGEEAVWERG